MHTTSFQIKEFCELPVIYINVLRLVHSANSDVSLNELNLLSYVVATILAIRDVRTTYIACFTCNVQTEHP